MSCQLNQEATPPSQSEASPFPLTLNRPVRSLPPPAEVVAAACVTLQTPALRPWSPSLLLVKSPQTLPAFLEDVEEVPMALQLAAGLEAEAEVVAWAVVPKRGTKRRCAFRVEEGEKVARSNHWRPASPPPPLDLLRAPPRMWAPATQYRSLPLEDLFQ